MSYINVRVNVHMHNDTEIETETGTGWFCLSIGSADIFIHGPEALERLRRALDEHVACQQSQPGAKIPVDSDSW